jgi:hypothetical protein
MTIGNPPSPMPSDPNGWLPEHMWGWVNEATAFMEAGQCLEGSHYEMLQGHGQCRPVLACFDRPSLVAKEEYSWERHIADEMVRIEFLTDRIRLSVIENLSTVLLARLVAVAAMVRVADDIMTGRKVGTALLSLGDSDWGQECIAFASQQDSPWLVPDPYFFLTRAYASERSEIAAIAKPWQERRPQLYWRGAPSGLAKYSDHADSQRVRLIMQTAQSPNRHRFNVRFAGLNGMDDAVADAVRAAGGDGPREPQMNILDYRYNVDVDGWSCAWTGFFIKLLAGAPVLKITSDRGFRQWFYNALQPWRHIVPVSADLSDLESAISILEARADWAEQIGQEGKIFAEKLNYESQLGAAGETIVRFADTHS